MSIKKIGRRKWSVVSLLVTLVAACLCAIVPQKNAVAQDAAIRLPDIAEQYSLGYTFTMPEAPEFEYGGKKYLSAVTLRDPIGNTHGEASVTLAYAGEYCLEYKAFTETGVLLKRTQTFDCLAELYSLSGEKSKVRYGTFEEYPDSQPGIALELTNGESFDVNRIVDLTAFDNSDYSGVMDGVIEFYVAPETLYTADARQIVVTFTDVFDPENVVTVKIKKVTPADENAEWASLNSYVTASAAFQPAVGLEKSNGGSVEWEDGQKYKLHKNDAYGAAINFSMTGGHSNKGSYVGKEKFSIGWDYENRRIYVQSYRDGARYRSIVSDLDDPALYGDLWNGFTTGEVYVSVSASNYQSGAARIVVTDIAGTSAEDRQNNVFSDDVAPVIEIDDQGYDNAPAAIVGEAYPVYEATAYDTYDGAVSVDVSVWKNYGSSFGARVMLADGAFTPTTATSYTVEYKAKDRFGSVATRTVDIQARDDIEKVTATLGECVTTGETGRSIPVGTMTLSKGTGKHTLSVSVYKKDDPSVVCEVINGEFIALEGGTYTVEYVYGDYIGKHTQSYDVAVSASATPYMDDEIVLPHYFIKNAVYELPEKYGYVFGENGAEWKKSTLLIRQDYGAFTVVTGNTVRITASESVTIAYQLGTSEGLFRREYRVDVVDVGFGEENALDLSKYFIGEDFTAESSGTSVTYKTSGKNGDTASLEFVKTIFAEKFKLNFGTSMDYRGFDTVNVTLADSLSEGISVRFTFRREQDGSAVFLLNGTGIKYPLGQNFFLADGSDFSIAYNSEGNSVQVMGETTVKIEKDAAGNEFNGFPSKFVYLTVELGGIETSQSDNAAIRILTVNNQTMSTVKNDIIEPEITTRTMRGEKHIGSIVEILPTVAGDVLDPYIKFEAVVKDPDGNVVIAEDGTVLQNYDSSKSYCIRLEKTGNYSVEYYAVDSAGWETFYSYVIRVVDTEPPKITLQSAATTGKVGETISIAAADVQDNMDSEVAVYKYMKTPAGRVIAFSQSNEGTEWNAFVAKERGIYTIYYYAFDSMGNFSVESYEIEVS